MRARLASLAGTVLACALAYGVFVHAESVAGMIGLPELQLIVRLGLTFIALGLADALAGRLFARLTPHP